MSWRLLALDLDGTLLEEDGEILPEVVERLTQVSAGGKLVTVASGRPETDIESLLAASGVTPMHGWPVGLVANERDVFVRDGDKFTPDEETNARLQRLETENLPSIRRVIDAWLAVQPDRARFSRYDDPATEELRKIVALRSPSLERSIDAQKQLSKIFELQRLPIQVFRNRSMLVFRHADICKGRALLRLANKLGVDACEVLAIGDSDNDRGMLDGRYEFEPGCPANAEAAIAEAVRSHGGIVASQPNGRGILEILADVE